MKRKPGKIFRMLLTIGIPLAVIGTPIAVVAHMKSENNAVVQSIENMYGDRYKYFLKTKSGKPLKLDIYDHTLSVVFDKGFSEEAKRNAKFALEGLDEILTDTEVKIYEDGNKPNHKNYIYLNLVEQDALHDGHSAGVTHVAFNEYSAKITYPVNIDLDQHYVDGYWSVLDGEVPSNSLFATVVQHEVGHALGLADLYDYTTASNSVMASELGHGTEFYSDVDKDNLQFVYCNDGSVVSYTATYPEEVELYDQRTCATYALTDKKGLQNDATTKTNQEDAEF